MGHKLHENMFYQNLFGENMSFYQNLFLRFMSFYQNLCCKSVVIKVIKDLSFHISKEKAARISCENILAALYDSLKKLYFLS